MSMRALASEPQGSHAAAAVLEEGPRLCHLGQQAGPCPLLLLVRAVGGTKLGQSRLEPPTQAGAHTAPSLTQLLPEIQSPPVGLQVSWEPTMTSPLQPPNKLVRRKQGQSH